MAVLALVCALFVSVGAAPASTTHDLTGTWDCCGSGGAANQTWTITSMDKGSGDFSGNGAGGSYTWPITGNVNGDSVTLTTPYNEIPYVAVFKGTISADGKTMSGEWDDDGSPEPSGTWTATRGSVPGGDGGGSDPSKPNAPKPTTPSGPGGTKAKAIPGDIYVTDSTVNNGAGAIYKVNPANGQSVLVHIGPPFVGIRGIAFGPEGNLFVTDIGAHAIRKIDLKNGFVTTVTAPFDPLVGMPWGIVYEPLLGEFLVTDALQGTVVRVDPKTGAVKPLVKDGGISAPHGIALEPGGAAYVNDYKTRSVIRVARSGGGWKTDTFRKGPFAALEGIATTGGGRFYVSDAIAPGGLSGTTAVTGVGGLFSWLGGGAPQLLYQPTTAAGVLLTPLGLAPSSDGQSLYIGSTGGLPNTGSIVEMDLATKKLRTLAGGFSAPLSIAVAAPKGVEVKVDAGAKGTSANANGVTTTVSSPAQPVAATVAVSVNVPSGFRLGARASKAVRVKAVTKPVPAGKPTKIGVAFKASLRKQIKAARRAGKKVKAKVTVTATAAAGASRKVVKQVSIK